MKRLMAISIAVLAATVAAASGTRTRSWTLNGDGEGIFARVTMYEAEDGVRLKTYHESRFRPVKLTREEAASLGRALLEAAGEMERPSNPRCSVETFICPGDKRCGFEPGFVPAGAP